MKTRSMTISLIVLAMALVWLCWAWIYQAAQTNLLSLQIERAVLNDPTLLNDVVTQLEQASKTDCRSNWHLGTTRGMLGDPVGQEAAWLSFLGCGAQVDLQLVHAGAPKNRLLAQQAVKLYPDQAESWFWLAEISADEKQLEQAIQQYKQVVQLDPVNGLSWCRLGNLLRGQNPVQARDAYLQCCNNGDPGSNGCYNAGGIEEQLGYWQNAIQYYRLSRWAGSQHRADELETKLTPTP